jgi:hypothetical protein
MDAVKQDWPVWDRDIAILLLRRDAFGLWQGVATDSRGTTQRVTYGNSRGLVFSGKAA